MLPDILWTATNSAYGLCGHKATLEESFGAACNVIEISFFTKHVYIVLCISVNYVLIASWLISVCV